MKKSILAIAALALLMVSCGKSQEAWTPLFNGENLDNWEKFLGPPFEGHEELAKTATPDNVFSLVDMDGQKVIRISGEVFGSLATKDTFSNFHARMVMKWGKKITRSLNCGFLYYGQGPLGAALGTWQSSIECQLQHGNMGGLYVIGDSVSLSAQVDMPDSDYCYKPGAETVEFSKADGKRMIRPGADAENPVGEWNTIEIYCVGQKSVHVVNGKVTMVTDGLSTMANGQKVALTGGSLQLQSEGSELFVKSVEIQPIAEIPASLLEKK